MRSNVIFLACDSHHVRAIAKWVLLPKKVCIYVVFFSATIINTGVPGFHAERAHAMPQGIRLLFPPGYRSEGVYMNGIPVAPDVDGEKLFEWLRPRHLKFIPGTEGITSNNICKRLLKLLLRIIVVNLTMIYI